MRNRVGGYASNSNNGECPLCGVSAAAPEDAFYPVFPGDMSRCDRLIWRGWIISSCNDQRIVSKKDAKAGGPEREICRFCELV
jgi:hypothetical protein